MKNVFPERMGYEDFKKQYDRVLKKNSFNDNNNDKVMKCPPNCTQINLTKVEQKKLGHYKQWKPKA